MPNTGIPPEAATRPDELSVARRRLRRFRVPVLLVALAAVLAGTRGLNVLAGHNAITGLAVGIGTAVGALAAYVWLSRTVEARRTVSELPTLGRWSGLRRGAAAGFVAFTATMLIIGIFGGWHHLGRGSFGGFLVTVGAMASVAVNEELLFRGVVFRILEERTGTVVALVVSSVIFGLTHLVNAHATVWGTLSIAAEGGTLLAAAYVATRSLWLPIGFHFAWDLTEGGIFGTANSGTTTDTSAGLLHTTLSGPDVLTGGTFGPEASLIALLVCLVPTVILLRRAARTGRLRRRLPRVG
ncbi:MAG: lysostaphin resistance A-like protein [Actinoallomurus sp.]